MTGRLRFRHLCCGDARHMRWRDRLYPWISCSKVMWIPHCTYFFLHSLGKLKPSSNALSLTGTGDSGMVEVLPPEEQQDSGVAAVQN
jgi:hypothetical protein